VRRCQSNSLGKGTGDKNHARSLKVKSKINNKIRGTRKNYISKKNLKKMASESDSDESVIILSDEDDENPYRQDDDKNVGTNGHVKEESMNTTKIKIDKKVYEVDDLEVHEKLVNTSNLVDKSKIGSHIGIGQHVSKSGDKEDTDDDEDQLFEKHYHHDMNFVQAKFLVKQRVGFVCDLNSNLDPVERRIKKLLDHADIMIMKRILDNGGGEVLSNGLDLRKVVPKPTPTVTKTAQPSTCILNTSPTVHSEFSDDDSPNTSNDLKNVVASVPQMPLVETGDTEVPELVVKIKEKEKFAFKPYKPTKKDVEKTRSTPKLLRPAIVFPTIKSKSFKIPRAVKAKIPRWVTNGSLWQWALTVDENGQYSRTVSTRTKVPWAGLVTKRPCSEEYQDWLVRGTFSEGDDCSWGEEEREKKSNEKTKMMREDFMWRERVLDKILGKEVKAVGMFSMRDPLGLDEKDSGTGTLEAGNATDDEMSIRDTVEELSENELNVSDQSLVTHIRTPTHTFCMEEDDINENSNNKVSESTDYREKNKNLSVDTRYPPQQETEVIQPFPSPPPSKVPSIGFVYTGVASSSSVSEVPDVRKCSDSSSAGPVAPAANTSAPSIRAVRVGDQSVLSMLVTGNKARLKLF